MKEYGSEQIVSKDSIALEMCLQAKYVVNMNSLCKQWFPLNANRVSKLFPAAPCMFGLQSVQKCSKKLCNVVRLFIHAGIS